MERGCYVLISDVQNPLLAINGRMVGGRYNGRRRKDNRKRQSSPTSQSPVIQRLDFLDSFFFLAAGDLDLERLDREELRWVLPGDRDLDRRRLDVELAGGLLDLPLDEFVRPREGDSRRSREPISGVGDLFGRLR